MQTLACFGVPTANELFHCQSDLDTSDTGVQYSLSFHPSSSRPAELGGISVISIVCVHLVYIVCVCVCARVRMHVCGVRVSVHVCVW